MEFQWNSDYCFLFREIFQKFSDQNLQNSGRIWNSASSFQWGVTEIRKSGIPNLALIVLFFVCQSGCGKFHESTQVYKKCKILRLL